MASPSDSAASSDAGEISTVKEADADMFDDQSIDNDFIIDLATRGRKTAKSSEKTKRLKGADEETSGLSFTTEEKENVDDDDAAWETDFKQENVDAEDAWATDINQENVDGDDAWETNIFKEFDGLMNKHDYFDTNSFIRLEDEVVSLLDRPFNEKGDLRKTVFAAGVMLMPIFLSSEPYVEEPGEFAVDFYNRKKEKNLVFVKVYKANYTNTEFGRVYFLTIDTTDSSLMMKRFQSCVLWPYDVAGRDVWSFKAIKTEEEEFHYQTEDDTDDGWETESFKTWPPFNWNFFDYRRIEYRYEKEKKEMIMDQLRLHCKEVRNSKGFDVETFPPSPYLWLDSPSMRGRPSKKDIDNAARSAVTAYNEREGKMLEFSNVSKVLYCCEKFTAVSDLLYFITSKAVDASTGENRTFRACVVHPKYGTMHVRYFKMKH